MSATSVATLADTWISEHGWTPTAPQIYFNFNSLTAGPVTMSLQNGAIHGPGIGYVSHRDNVFFHLPTFRTNFLVKPSNTSI